VLFDLLGYRNRWRVLERLGRDYVSETAPIVIGGCGSSGTTLLRRMLNRHPAIVCGAESTVFLERVTGPAELGPRMGFAPSEIERWQRESRSQAEFIDRFQAACLAHARKSIWADKTPENITRVDFVWRHFPKARFVHMIRDGRDVACSLRRQSWMKLDDRSADDIAARCATYWVERVSTRHRLAGDPRYTELRYEDLVRQPEKTLHALMETLGLEWSDRMHAPDEQDRGDPAAGPAFTSSVGRWRKELSEPEIAAVKSIAGPLLIELGYERNDSWQRETGRVTPASAT
jgi:protein-tyrosine sulfotransferase